MKIKIDIDCTPEEARTFLGLPDVQPMQQWMMSQMQDRMEKGIENFDPETIMKAWITPGIEGFGQLQKALWAAAAGEAGKPAKK